eukprot:CAMPEP_0174893166 /NCGR_PEP_ID=MMETSP0167-20121228/8003_1 /TAXON_ID=38298 /ORGANISM="Rhodella maculata, Strain CCMP736" /LENGTH=75 /DNA_ID=CAMNT_0016131877 /DNA_START=6 /DNA_END=233 /DNA_ORIENTATION=+
MCYYVFVVLVALGTSSTPKPEARKDVYDFKGVLQKCRNLGMGDAGGAVVVPDRSGRVFGDVDGFMKYLLELKARS